MGLKNLLKKGILCGPVGMIEGHIIDALKKKKKTLKSFRDCLEESVKETITEDIPGTSHVYQMGRKDGRAQGTFEQAHRDEQKFKALHKQHEQDRREWKATDKKKDALIDDLAKEAYRKG